MDQVTRVADKADVTPQPNEVTAFVWAEKVERRKWKRQADMSHGLLQLGDRS
jgi:hypothetical protein